MLARLAAVLTPEVAGLLAEAQRTKGLLRRRVYGQPAAAVRALELARLAAMRALELARLPAALTS